MLVNFDEEMKDLLGDTITKKVNKQVVGPDGEEKMKEVKHANKLAGGVDDKNAN